MPFPCPRRPAPWWVPRPRGRRRQATVGCHAAAASAAALIGVVAAAYPATGQTETRRITGNTTTCNSQNAPSCSAIVDCPTGMVVLGGGALGVESKLESSYPSSTMSWTIGWYRADEEYASAADALATPYAICGPTGLSGYEIAVGDTQSCLQAASCTTMVPCPDGKVVLGGGMLGDQVKLESSYPSSTTSWTIGWYRADEEYASAAHGQATPYAVCVGDAPSGHQIVSSDMGDCHLSNTPSCTVTAGCPEGQVISGGGLEAAESKAESSFPDSSASWTVGWYRADEEYASAAAGTAIARAVCVDTVPPFFADDFESGNLDLWSAVSSF